MWNKLKKWLLNAEYCRIDEWLEKVIESIAAPFNDVAKANGKI